MILATELANLFVILRCEHLRASKDDGRDDVVPSPFEAH